MRSQMALALAFAALSGCARQTPMPDAFSENLAGWHRIAVREIAVSRPPDPIPAANIEAIRAAAYEGPGKLEARVYALPSPAVALDVAQRWTPRPETVFFYADRFFIVVQWQTADKKSLQTFVSELQKRFARKA